MKGRRKKKNPSILRSNVLRKLKNWPLSHHGRALHSVLGLNISFLIASHLLCGQRWQQTTLTPRGLHSRRFRVLGVNTERAKFLREIPAVKFCMCRDIKKCQCLSRLPHLPGEQNAGAFHLQRLTFPSSWMPLKPSQWRTESGIWGLKSTFLSLLFS